MTKKDDKHPKTDPQKPAKAPAQPDVKTKLPIYAVIQETVEKPEKNDDSGQEQ